MAESTTVVTLLLRAIERAPVQQVFDRDPYESRRTALPGSRLVKVLVIYQMIKSTKLRGLVRAIEEHGGLQTALDGEVERNTLSNALAQRNLEQMIEAWMLLLQAYEPWIARLGKKFARLAIVDASLIKLSLAAFAWAQYRKQSGAAKMHAVLEWGRGIPQQLVFTLGKVHDLKGAAQMRWIAHWTYVFDRGYFCFKFLAGVMAAGAHFVVRFKDGVNYRILERSPVPVAPATAGIRLRSDWRVSLPGWPGVVLRLVSYQLPDGKLIRVLTSRFDLSAVTIAQLYKERWTIEQWWKWIKYVFKIKEPMGRSANALPVQIVGAFVTDLLLRAFKQSSGFTSSTYEFVVRCQEVSLTPLDQILENSALRQALETILKLLSGTQRHLQLVA
ncbi:MAG: IS4 family transposase [Acidobacteria bacterium]|nr:IS4 family transposase [Acidobacteriota bacterium]